MVIRCPKCNFTAKLVNRSHPVAAQYPHCPRCHTQIPLPASRDNSAVSLVQAEPERSQPLGVPWEARSSWLDLASFWRTSLNVLFHPSATFSALDYSGGIRSSLLFALVYGSLGHILGRYWFTLLGIHYGILEGDALTNTLRFAAVALSVPLSLLIFMFVTASLGHICLRMLFAAKRSFAATFQVVAYGSGAVSLFNLIPVVGSFLVPAWAFAVWCIGLAKAHQTSRARTLLALLLPVLITGLLVALAILVVAAKGLMEVLRNIQLHG